MCLNTASIAKRKSNWIDFNAGELIESNDFENMTEEIFKLLIDIASGRQRTSKTDTGTYPFLKTEL
jgi:altronate hydrolase